VRIPDRAVRLTSSHDRHDQLDVTLVSIDGDARIELVCAGTRLLVANGSGVLSYRTGYEDLARSMARAMGPVR
jgi:hypothetical protein